MTLAGIGLIARQEFRTRIRTGHWKALLAVWFVLVNGLGLLFRLTIGVGDDAALVMFGSVMLAVLVLVLLIAPALSGQAINGDRERGTLAALQVTRLSPADIALGKLAAAWGTGTTVLVLALPVTLVPVLEGAVSPFHHLAVVGIMIVQVGVVVTLSLGWSGVVARGVTSVLLSYLTVFGLLVGTMVVGAIFDGLATRGGDLDGPGTARNHAWWVMSPNPVVVLADAAPRLEARHEIVTLRSGRRVVVDDDVDGDLLGELSRDLREMREPKPSYRPDGSYRTDPGEGGPVWPYGLAVQLALAGLALGSAVRGLRTPVRILPSGVRIA
ncbi:ABC transporter permease [Actinomadura flavalba]|uniref:ABC transporter permease n=1 Tax=Actinomadura flavalba TaxID=1120938 RepID=UPI00035CF708|nr:ABC transporter permease [Actinomadura flavalba]